MKSLFKLSAAAAMLICASMYTAASADSGEITYYDVSAYINNYPIPCYSVSDYCGVYVSDLRHYGFSVDYDDETHTVFVARDASESIEGIPDVRLPYQKNGTFYAQAEWTDNKVLLDGEETKSYCVGGKMLILLDNMRNYGTVDWDAERHAVFMNIDGLPSAEYAPLKKAVRTYSRYKPGVYELDHDKYYDYSSNEVDWGFVRVEGDEPRLEWWQAQLLADHDAYYMDRSKPHKIYLTFDEGYENGYTPLILDVLTKYNVPATFFVTGQFLDESGYLVQEMIDRGFSVGNHTVNHRNLARCSISDVMSEIDGVSNTLRDTYGYKTVYMRPPEGAVSERVLAIAKDMGYNTILWSFAYYDYDPSNQHGTDYAYDMITRYMHDGAIYLLHAVSRDNAYSLESVIQYAIEHGYEFGSLDELCQP